MKFVFYDNFLNYCEEKGESPSRILSNLGISKGSLSRWKDGGEPSNPTKKKLADYFGITVSELMRGETKKIPVTEVNEDNELNDLLEEARRNPDLRILFSLGANATKDDVKKYIKVIKLMCGDDDGTNDY